MQTLSTPCFRRGFLYLSITATVVLVMALAVQPRFAAGRTQDPPTTAPSSYDQISPVLLGQQTFEKMKAKDINDKPAVMARQKELLQERYDLSVRVSDKVKMSRGKPIPIGPATKLPPGTKWDDLA